MGLCVPIELQCAPFPVKLYSGNWTWSSTGDWVFFCSFFFYNIQLVLLFIVITAENLCVCFFNNILLEQLISCQFTVISLFFRCVLKIIGLWDVAGTHIVFFQSLLYSLSQPPLHLAASFSNTSIDCIHGQKTTKGAAEGLQWMSGFQSLYPYFCASHSLRRCLLARLFTANTKFDVRIRKLQLILATSTIRL